MDVSYRRTQTELWTIRDPRSNCHEIAAFRAALHVDLETEQWHPWCVSAGWCRPGENSRYVTCSVCWPGRGGGGGWKFLRNRQWPEDETKAGRLSLASPLVGNGVGREEGDVASARLNDGARLGPLSVAMTASAATWLKGYRWCHSVIPQTTQIKAFA